MCILCQKSGSVNLCSEHKRVVKSSSFCMLKLKLQDWTFQKETWGEKEQPNQKKIFGNLLN